MDNAKVGYVESDDRYINIELKKKSCNKMKYTVGGIKPDKLETTIIGAIFKSPRLAKYKLWGVGVTLIILLLWVCGVQLSAFQDETVLSALAIKYHEPRNSSSPPSYTFPRGSKFMLLL